MRDYEGFGDAGSPKNALLIECGQHWERSAVAVARDTTARFLLLSAWSKVKTCPAIGLALAGDHARRARHATGCRAEHGFSLRRALHRPGIFPERAA